MLAGISEGVPESWSSTAGPEGSMYSVSLKLSCKSCFKVHINMSKTNGLMVGEERLRPGYYQEEKKA